MLFKFDQPLPYSMILCAHFIALSKCVHDYFAFTLKELNQFFPCICTISLKMANGSQTCGSWLTILGRTGLCPFKMSLVHVPLKSVTPSPGLLGREEGFPYLQQGVLVCAGSPPDAFTKVPKRQKLWKIRKHCVLRCIRGAPCNLQMPALLVRGKEAYSIPSSSIITGII